MASTFAQTAEGIRAAIAKYAQALEDRRIEDVVGTFCPDGSIDISGLGRQQGREAIQRAYEGLSMAVPHRHVVVNTLMTHWNDDEATSSSDLIDLARDSQSTWGVCFVGRYEDTLHRGSNGEWRFHTRKLRFVGEEENPLLQS